jgi:3-deoxy-7-phosphoheptulonate synthase
MLVVMRHDAAPGDIQRVIDRITEMGYGAAPIPGKQRTAVGLIGNDGKVDASRLECLAGVMQVIHVTQPYKQVSREWRDDPTIIELANGTTIGGTEVPIMAGPCSVESEAQIIEIAHRLREAGATILRGGAFKPRSSPYSFQGLGEAGLRYLARARAENGLALVTEAIDPESADLAAEYADIVQIGARNMQNFSLLRRAGRAGKPVLLKRGFAATLNELLLSAEYILAEGNGQVILCERGVRGFDNHTRNLLDLTAIPVVKSLSHLPIIADPSHGTGLRAKVIPMARAAVAAGADGLMVEVHQNPDEALADGNQTLFPKQFEELMEQIRVIAEAIGRRITPALAAAPPPVEQLV